jgi:hypothetical protein
LGGKVYSTTFSLEEVEESLRQLFLSWAGTSLDHQKSAVTLSVKIFPRKATSTTFPQKSFEWTRIGKGSYGEENSACRRYAERKRTSSESNVANCNTFNYKGELRARVTTNVLQSWGSTAHRDKATTGFYKVLVLMKLSSQASSYRTCGRFPRWLDPDH